MEQYKQRQEQRCLEHLTSAVATMRNYLNKAERAIASDRLNSHEKIREVLSNFTWGMANASAAITTAMCAAEDSENIPTDSE